MIKLVSTYNMIMALLATRVGVNCTKCRLNCTKFDTFRLNNDVDYDQLFTTKLIWYCESHDTAILTRLERSKLYD